MDFVLLVLLIGMVLGALALKVVQMCQQCCCQRAMAKNGFQKKVAPADTKALHRDPVHTAIKNNLIQ